MKTKKTMSILLRLPLAVFVPPLLTYSVAVALWCAFSVKASLLSAVLLGLFNAIGTAWIWTHGRSVSLLTTGIVTWCSYGLLWLLVYQAEYLRWKPGAYAWLWYDVGRMLLFEIEACVVTVVLCVLVAGVICACRSRRTGRDTQHSKPLTGDDDDQGTPPFDPKAFVREMLILFAVLGMVAASVIPVFSRARNISQQNACVGNLRIIDSGKEQCAMAYRLTDGDTIASVSVNEYFKGSTTPICPGGGVYIYNKIDDSPECSVRTPTVHALP